MADQEKIKKESYDLIICLDDEKDAAQLASAVQSGEIVGAYWQDGKVRYTDSVAEWFDMGLISRFGKARADQIKMKNRRTYQEILFSMFGAEFNGEEYCINLDCKKNVTADLVIGIEDRAGDRWPTKRWHKYPELAERLREDGFEVRFFEQRPTIQEYAADIAQADLVIAGDTLGMHLALALKKRMICLFTITSPYEIYGYGLMCKIVSPLLEKYFYQKEYYPEVLEAIPLDTVYAQVKESLKGIERV